MTPPSCIRLLLTAILLATSATTFDASSALADPAPVDGSSEAPEQTIALPHASDAWRVILTVSGGRIARFAQYVVASDGNAASTISGNTTLEVHAFANVASTVGVARDARWSIPNESTCCDRSVSLVTLERRLPNGHVATHQTQTAQSGTPLPGDAANVVAAIRDAFAPTSAPTPASTPR